MKQAVILDIGKTHIKLHLKNSVEETLDYRVKNNQTKNIHHYPHYDVDAIWDWLTGILLEWSSQHTIEALAITTHGATAALINRFQGGNGLALPVLDYEFEGLNNITAAYENVRPSFVETGSPKLPAGLNLGQQLFWQQKNFADDFAKATDILMYPQYWAWRLTGERCSEVTSLGCHTDLWNPYQSCFSSLVDRAQWRSLFPGLKRAYDVIGTIHPSIQQQTGLSADCQVYAGIHDSNASYYRYKAILKNQPFTILSTGTWCIAMKNQLDSFEESTSPELNEARDQLINVDATNTPIVCSRFMAGREMEKLCKHLGGDISEPYSLKDIKALVNNGCYCSPSWVPKTGPFPNAKASVQGVRPENSPASALATLYLALMIDIQLDLVAAQGRVILEGSYVKNPHLCEILASLRPQQLFHTSQGSTGTVSGTFMLTMEENEHKDIALTQVAAVSIPGLSTYKNLWRELIDQPILSITKKSYYSHVKT